MHLHSGREVQRGIKDTFHHGQVTDTVSEQVHDVS